MISGGAVWSDNDCSSVGSASSDVASFEAEWVMGEDYSSFLDEQLSHIWSNKNRFHSDEFRIQQPSASGSRTSMQSSALQERDSTSSSPMSRLEGFRSHQILLDMLSPSQDSKPASSLRKQPLALAKLLNAVSSLG